jgi:transcription antitermination factor NusG
MVSPSDGTREFVPGDHVRVTGGYFQSYQGVVESVDSMARCAVVTIDIFGRPHSAEVPFEQFERSSDRPDQI